MTDPLRRRLNTINRRARRRGMVGRLTLEELQHKVDDARGRCPSCGIPFSERFFRRRWVLWSAGDVRLSEAVVICRECEMKRTGRIRTGSAIYWGLQHGR